MAATEMDTGKARSTKELLILAIMKLVDRNVDVHARDGSVFSGIFYTASFEKDYSLVLKNARMTRRGKSSANVTEGVPISMLVIQSDDLVQIVVKEDELPSKGIAGNDVEAVADTIPSSEFMATTCQKEEHINQTRQTRDDISQREHDGYSEQIVGDIEEGSSLQLDSSGIQVTPVDERYASGVSSSSRVVGVSSNMSFHSSAALTEVVSLQGSESNTSTQLNPEAQNFASKLNPDAQNFAPSLTNSGGEFLAGQENANMASVPNYHAARPEVGVGPHAYQYHVPRNGAGPQIPQPVVRDMGNEMQPVRFAGQNPLLHPEPPYVQQKDHNAMAATCQYPWQNFVGYMHQPHMQEQPYIQHSYVQHTNTHHPHMQQPYVQYHYIPDPYGNVIVYDVTHGTAPMPPHPQANPYQVPYPRNQGQALQLCMPPSLLTCRQQRIAVPSHFSLLQSCIATNRRIPISGSNGLFSTKLS